MGLLQNNEKVKCACGCGELIDKYDSQGRERRYKLYHFGKWMKDVWAEGRANPNSLKGIGKNVVPWHKGKKLPKELKKKLSEARLKGLKDGKIKVWNKGLTTKDERVKKIMDKLHKAHMEKIDIVRKKQSETRKRLFKEKKLISTWLGKKLSLEQRKKISAIQQGKSLEEWDKFISFEPYNEDFNKNFKKNIRKRDNQICMLCGIHREKLNKALDVHHINYNKKLTIPENCISLCHSCHTKTNHNREQWTSFFHSLLNKKYGYNYTENKEPIISIGGEKNGVTSEFC
jgi:hypothetical protein